MRKYKELENKYGSQIGISTDRGAIFWDNEKKCRIYEDPESSWTEFGKINTPTFGSNITNLGACCDTHEESWNTHEDMRLKQQKLREMKNEKISM